MRIHQLSSMDWKRLLEFYESLSLPVAELFRPFGEPSEQVIRGHLSETDIGKHISFGLVLHDGTVEGHAFVQGIDSERPVFGIGLREHVHGRGWGRRLAETILREADNRALPLVTLTVVKVNTRATALYEKLGFVLKGEHTFRQENDSHYMEREGPSVGQ